MARRLQDVIALLNRLIQLDYNAIDATKAALSQLPDPHDRTHLGACVEDHRNHIDDLAMVVRNLGGEPLCPSDLWRIRPNQPASLPPPPQPAGPPARSPGDLEALESLRCSEDQVRVAYDRAISQPGVPLDVLAALERNIVHVKKQLTWIGGRLADATSAHDESSRRSTK